MPRQWSQEDAHVQVTELPCSGKTDAQYLFHALEGGARGVLIVTCPEGNCRLAQGNYRAKVRIRTVQRLLEEVGAEPERAALVRCDPDDDLEGLVREAVRRFCVLGENPIATASWAPGGSTLSGKVYIDERESLDDERATHQATALDTIS